VDPVVGARDLVPGATAVLGRDDDVVPIGLCLTALAKAGRVFSGASAQAPRWPMMSGRSAVNQDMGIRN